MANNSRAGMFTRQLVKFYNYERNVANVLGKYDINCYIKESGSGTNKEIDMYTKDFELLQGDLVYFSDATWLIMSVKKNVESSGYDRCIARHCVGTFFVTDTTNSIIYEIPYAISGETSSDLSFNNFIQTQDVKTDVFISQHSHGATLLTNLNWGTPLFIADIKYAVTFVNKTFTRLWNLALANTAKDPNVDDVVIGVPNRWEIDTKKKYEIRNIVDIYEFAAIDQQTQLEPKLYIDGVEATGITYSDFKYVLSETLISEVSPDGIVTPIQNGTADLWILFLDENGIPYARVLTRIRNSKIMKRILNNIVVTPEEINFDTFNDSVQLSVVSLDQNGEIIPDFYFFTSSDPEIVSVNSTGLVSSRETNGTASIVIESRYEPGFTVSILVNVQAADVVEYYCRKSIGDSPQDITKINRYSRNTWEFHKKVNGVEQPPIDWTIANPAVFQGGIQNTTRPATNSVSFEFRTLSATGTFLVRLNATPVGEGQEVVVRIDSTYP